MPKIKTKKIHVNQWNVKRNAKGESPRLPVFTVKTYNSNTYGHEVAIEGPSRLVYRPDKPMPCGAKAWIETQAQVRIINQENQEEIIE